MGGLTTRQPKPEQNAEAAERASAVETAKPSTTARRAWMPAREPPPPAGAGAGDARPFRSPDSARSRGPYGTLVDAAVTPSPTQVERSVFLDEVSRAVREAADEELAKVGRSSAGCPYLDYWLDYYRDQAASHVERAIERYGRPASADPASLQEAVVKRTRAAVAKWVASGKVDAPVSPDASDDGVEPKAADSPDAQAASEADAVRAQLGAGAPLDPATRERMERALGHDLGDARVHAGSRAAALAQARSAAAFTVGHDIAFAAGRYRPGTITGDAMLAHELAHTVQQREAKRGATDDRALESNANELAVRAVARMHAPWVAAQAQGKPSVAHQLAQIESRPTPRPLAAGLRLLRCSAPEAATDVQYKAPYLAAASTPAVPAASELPDPTTLLSASDAGWTRVTDDSMLAVQAQEKLFLVPSRFFVSTGTDGPMAAAAPADPGRRPVVGLPAVGHGSLQLINVGGGSGLMVDAGGAGGATRVILPGALRALTTSLGITQVDNVLLVHTHADHVRHLVELVRSGAIRGNTVFIWPGWEKATTGPWAKALAALRDPSLSANGFGPTWSPTPLTTTTVGRTGTELTVATLRLGGAELSMVTLTSALRDYVDELGNDSSGTQTADASSMLTRVRVPGAADTLVVGDLRGRTIAEIRTQMEAGGTRFSDWVSQVRVVIGFHHLGDVATGGDTAGYRDLLRSLAVGQGVTVVAQANATKVNEDFVRRLQASGISVVVLPEGDANALRQFTLSQSGKVNAPGASVFDAKGAATEAEQRVTILRDAAAVLRNPTVVEPLFQTGSADASARLADALDAEAAALTQQVRDRRALEITGLESGTRAANYAQAAAASDQAIRAGIAQAHVAPEDLTALARMKPRLGELQKLLEEVAKSGESRPELRKLLEEVGPEVYREVLARRAPEEPSSAAARMAAIRGSLAELLQQRELQRAMQTGNAPMGALGRGVAGLMILVELANDILPMVARARDASNASATQQMLSLVGALGWWARLGLNVPFHAMAGSTALTVETLVPSILRRVWEASPPNQRPDEDKLDANVKKAAPLDSLTVPSVTSWPVAFWALFVERLATLVPTWNEWSRWFDDDRSAGIRAANDDVTTSPWQALTGTFSWSGSSQPLWETNDQLTKIMNARATAARSGTTAWLGQEVRVPEAHAQSDGPSIGVPADQKPTRRAVTFKPNVAREAISPYQMKPVKGFTWNANPSFVSYENASAPSGLVWVTGSDEATYRVIRKMRVFVYDENAVVQLPHPSLSESTYEDTTGPTAFAWIDSHGTDEEKAAVALVRNQADGVEYVAYGGKDPRRYSYYGEIRFAADRPNTSGMILVVSDELTPAASPSGGKP